MPDIGLRLGSDVLVVEGPLAPLLERCGFDDATPCELLCITEPEAMEHMHARQLEAGADCLVATTFGANARLLDVWGLADNIADICAAAVQLARACKPQHVLAGMGPCGAALPHEARALYGQQARALAAACPEALVLGGFGSLPDALMALEAVRQQTDIPALVCCAFDAGGLMPASGTTIAQATRTLESAGAAGVGLWGMLEPQQMAPLAKRMARSTSLPVLAAPLIAVQMRIGRDGVLYDASADVLAQAALDMANGGVALLGTCGNATPVHTAALYAAVAGMPVARR